MAIYKCKMCGGELNISDDMKIIECDYCGTKQTLPKLDDEQKANLYDRANHFRRNNEYDKAMTIYENILNTDTTDSEAYWSILLCKYGVEYVKDSATGRYIPTINRAQYTSVLADEDYKSAIKYADSIQREIYENEAKYIDEVQKGIIEISQKEEPFDVFICYKETDNNGRRTQDSVLANELYHGLTNEGFRVFFSRITLEDKLGTAYEPYIFAALNSAKVMVVIGTKPEYFNAVWVKNEWSRFLSLIKNGANKILIPAYRDMDPYDLPEEFSHLQAQDMSKLGFMQDIVRGIIKITPKNEPKETVKETVVVNEGSANVESLLKRAFMFLEDGDFKSANEYAERVLDIDPENADAYLAKLLANKQCRTKEELKNAAIPFDNDKSYEKVVKFGTVEIKAELKGYIDFINDRNETERKQKIYNNGMYSLSNAKTEEDFKNAAETFNEILEFKDAKAKYEECLEKAEKVRKDTIYVSANNLVTKDTVSALEEAIHIFSSISGWRDVDDKVNSCQKRINEINDKEEQQRIEAERKAEQERLEQEKQAEEKRIAAIEQTKKTKKIIAIGAPILSAIIVIIILLNFLIIPSSHYNAGIKFLEEGKYEDAIKSFELAGNYKDAEYQTVNTSYDHAISLKEAGNEKTAITMFFKTKGYKDTDNHLRELLSNTISAGENHTVALKSNGTVVATEYIVVEGKFLKDNYAGQCEVSDWNDIVSVSAGFNYTVGLKNDGTVVAIGNNEYGQCEVSNWKDIVAISAGNCHTVGLKSDGTVVAVGNDENGQCEVSDWKDIVSISAGFNYTVALKSDGTVIAVGENEYGQCEVSNWNDIVSISAGVAHTVGLKNDGTVIAIGGKKVAPWTDMISISAGWNHTAGLKKDGTVVSVDNNGNEQSEVSDWTNIIAISASYNNTVGLRKDGTAVAVGDNKHGKCDVSGWTHIKVK